MAGPTALKRRDRNDQRGGLIQYFVTVSVHHGDRHVGRTWRVTEAEVVVSKRSQETAREHRSSRSISERYQPEIER
jgi:hypothetical protein